MKRVLASVCILAVSTFAVRAHAFQNRTFFAAEAVEAGGGGKYFTGSRAEGYTCQVCHSSDAPVPLTVSGLPIDGYQPGQTYHITIDWPDDLRSVALNLELTDFDGGAFGELFAPDPAALAVADRCIDNPEVPSSGQTLEPNAGRRIMLVGECGQTQTSFDWRAPALATSGFLSGSLVASNRDGKVKGDRVTDFSRAFSAAGIPEPRVDHYAGGCSARTLNSDGGSWLWMLLLVVGACARSRR